jgi:putative glutamine amidotransferase
MNRKPMNRKPIIGLNADFQTNKTTNQSYTFLHSRYSDVIAESGGIPMILPPMENREDLAEIMRLVDGVVLVGGMDLDCRRDGYYLHDTMKLIEERRESFDRLLVDEIISSRKPVFGVGLGMQLLNVACGGNLSFHIPTDFEDAIPHYDLLESNHRHVVKVEPDSVMEKVYGDSDVRVNSRHHMAVDLLAPGFRATALCPSGIIEAMESKMDDWFAIGTQFHPECSSAAALDKRLFAEFVEVIRNPGSHLPLESTSDPAAEA